jgi:hypothetical protein
MIMWLVIILVGANGEPEQKQLAATTPEVCFQLRDLLNTHPARPTDAVFMCVKKAET